MSKAIDNRNKRYDYEIMFLHSPEYFVVSNCKMIFENQMLRFICYNEDGTYKEDVWFPYISIYRVKKYG